MDLIINNKFYKFEKYLQKGSFGMTFLYKKNDQYYTIKFFYPKDRDNKSFLNEKKILELLKNKVGCLDYLICFIEVFYITKEDPIYDNIYNMMLEKKPNIYKKNINGIITEYIDGFDLYDYFESEGLLEEDIFKFILFMFKCLKTLEELHIAHRDIKLENIIRKNDGNYTLIDFGLSCISDNSGSVGTENYIPTWFTSQNNHFNDYIYQDVYGFITCIYVLINGRYPYEKNIFSPSNSNNQFLDKYVNYFFETKKFYLYNIENYYIELLIKYNYLDKLKLYNEFFNYEKKI